MGDNVKVGDRVKVAFEGKVTYRSGGYVEVRPDGGTTITDLNPGHLTRVIPTEPGVGAVVDIDGTRWQNLGGSAKWAQLGTRNSILSGVTLTYPLTGKTWEQIYQPNYKLLTTAL